MPEFVDPAAVADKDFGADVTLESSFYERFVHVAPKVWPGDALKVQPSDMSSFLPMGLGMGGPVMIRPWDDPFKLTTSWNDWYGVQPRTGHPKRDAPLTEPAGGTVFFDDDIEEAQFKALLQLLKLQRYGKDYAAFIDDADEPRAQGYLTTLRVLGGAAIKVFGIKDELPEQPIDAETLMWTFIRRERLRPRSIRGSFGGDGDWAKEALCFGLMVENSAWAAFRIWSRAWLVTK
jgi:hypothetical protein